MANPYSELYSSRDEADAGGEENSPCITDGDGVRMLSIRHKTGTDPEQRPEPYFQNRRFALVLKNG